MLPEGTILKVLELDQRKYKREGRQHMTSCPCCNGGKKTPNCSVDSVKNVWRCHACGEGGHVKDMCKLLNINFKEFLEREHIKLDSKAPTHNTPPPPPPKPNDLGWFARSDFSQKTVDYLASRNIDARLVKNQLYELKQGFEHGQFRLCYESGHRLVVPMFTPSGDCISCKFRKITPTEGKEPKTYNQAGRGVYMIGWRNLAAIKHEGQAIICEGEIDYASLYAADFHNVLAVPSATYTLKPDEIRTLPKTVLLMLDQNSAGKQGAKRIAQQIHKTRKDVKIKICELPRGSEDVNELLSSLEGNLDKFYIKILHSLEQAQFFINEESTRTALGDRVARWKELALAAKDMPNGRPESKVISTGVDSLDELLAGGFRRGLYAIAGRPGVGKTNLGLGICDKILQKEGNENTYAIFFSVEMEKGELENRVLSWKARVDYNNIVDETLNLYEVEKIENAIANNPHLNRLIIIDSDRTVEEMEKTIYSLRSSLPDSKLIFFFDYLQQITTSDNTGEKRERVGRVSYKLKELSLAVSSPFVAISSTSRAQYTTKDNKINPLTTFKESGDIEFSLYGALLFNPCEVAQALKNTEKGIQATLCKHRFGKEYNEDGSLKNIDLAIDFANGNIREFKKTAVNNLSI